MNRSATCCAALAAFGSAAIAQTICGTWVNAPPLVAQVNAIVRFQGQTYLGGNFFGVGGNYVTRWDGSAYVPLPLQIQQGQVTSLAVYDDGTGPALYAGGSSFNLPNQPLPRTYYGVVKWDGQSWSGTGFPSNPGGVADMAVYDDGQGPALYALTQSSSALWRWRGGTWAPVPGAPSGWALAGFDDGGGPALYVGGSFTLAGGVPASNLARLSQGVWSQAAGGVNGPVTCIRVLDLGQGPRLFAAGEFNRAGTTPVQFVASWDGASWAAYPFTGYHMFQLAGGRTFTSFAALRDARNRPLLALGSADFSTYPGGEVRGGVLVWDGERWFSGGGPASQGVNALLADEIGGSQGILVGGWMPGPTALAEWVPAPQCYPNCDCSSETNPLSAADFMCFLQRFAAGDLYANCDNSTTPPVLNVLDFTCFLNRFAAGCE
jgi:hypothetical protein